MKIKGEYSPILCLEIAYAIDNLLFSQQLPDLSKEENQEVITLLREAIKTVSDAFRQKCKEQL